MATLSVYGSIGHPRNEVPLLGGVLRPPRTRRGTGPSHEGAAEGAEFRIAQQEGNLRQAQIGVPEISEGQIMAKLVQDLSKAHPQTT